MKIAIVGSGISGLAAAHRLQGEAHVTLFEAGSYFGGHTHTGDVTLPTPEGKTVTHGVDTGFLVFNERTYPQLIALLAELKVETAKSDMSFSVQVPGAAGGRALEWSGSSLSTVFAQRSNLLRPRFWGMLSDLLRFNQLTTRLALANEEAALAQPLGDFLQQQRFGDAFRDWYFLPMLGCIWSCPTEQMLRFPVATMVRFCHNHGLLQVSDRPQWHTVTGGARHYVERMRTRLGDVRLRTPVHALRRLPGGGVAVQAADGEARFDAVIVASHADQTLGLLGAQASAQECALLGAIRYHPNRAVLHTDATQLPRRQRAWAAWNYEHAGDDGAERAGVCLHYLLNRLQPMPWPQPVIVSLNPVRPIRPACVLGEFDYSHPIFDLAAIAAQRRLASIQGAGDVWYAGAWTGYGFHEDGLSSGLAAAQALQARWSAGATDARAAA